MPLRAAHRRARLGSLKGVLVRAAFGRLRIALFGLLGLIGLIGGCRPLPSPTWLLAETEPIGVYHTVKPSQTLSAICRAYAANLQEVAEINDLQDPNALEVGQEIFIPDASKVLPDLKPVSTQDSASKLSLKPGVPKPAGTREEEQRSDQVQTFRGKFVWPIEGVITSKFGIRNGRRHDGIDISAPEGTPIHASADGEVIFAGDQGSYGLVVILRHADRIVTVYAHSKRILVSEGNTVKQGQPIALVGATGRTTGPHVHFEIREGTKPRNPLFFLPR